MKTISRILFYFSWLLLPFQASANGFDNSVYDELDYGLYWAGANNQFEKASINTVNGSAYYDPAKPTVIYIHGWQAGSVVNLYRETFYETTSGRPDVDLANLWIAEGYNIGVIYWNQFADESEVQDAEAKIWSTQGNQKMRWIDSSGTYHYGDVDTSVPELLFEDFSVAMSAYEGNNLRFVGHSLGSQVSFRLAKLISDSVKAGKTKVGLLPQRISILDAYFSNGGKDYLNGYWVGDVVRDIADELITLGLAIDSYRTSATTSSVFVGDENRELHNKLAFAEQSSSYFWFWQLTEKHVAAVWLYFWSIIYPEPIIESSNLPGISATASDDLVKTWMSARMHIKQSDGGNTKDPIDDMYRKVNRL